MKFNAKSRKGFTLIELLVVIGILAVLAAIAIPSVAGLIDRANQSSDNTNAKEMTNAIERFTSEYELYCQDVASGTLDVTDLDSAQGRVFNVTEIETRKGVEMTENLGYTHDIVAVDRDTKYPVNEVTAKKVIENFMKTSSSTFEPKQSDCSYYYSPQVGKVVVAKTGSTIAELNKIAMEDEVEYATINNGEIIEWINLSVNAGKEVNDWTYVNAATPTNNQYKELGTKAPTFNIEWSAKNEATGQPVTVGVSISNSNYSGNGTTPCTMTNVPMGKYALVATYAGNEYKFNLLVYQEGIQTFKLTIPGTNISVGSDNDTYVPSGTPNTPNTPDTPNVPTPSIKSFNIITVDKTIQYQYEEGMTWRQWIVSDYNDGILFVKESGTAPGIPQTFRPVPDGVLATSVGYARNNSSVQTADARTDYQTILFGIYDTGLGGGAFVCHPDDVINGSTHEYDMYSYSESVSNFSGYYLVEIWDD